MARRKLNPPSTRPSRSVTVFIDVYAGANGEDAWIETSFIDSRNLGTLKGNERYLSRQEAIDGSYDEVREILLSAESLPAQARTKIVPRPIGPWFASGPRVYFVQGIDGGLVKIGHTTDLPMRLSALQAGSPVRLHLIAAYPAELAEEKSIHRRFDHLRRHGEWFCTDDELISFIKSLPMPSKPVELPTRDFQK